MKATYQKPATEIVKLSAGAILTTNSNGILKDDITKTNFDLSGTPNETSETSGNLSRRSIWDEEEEDF